MFVLNPIDSHCHLDFERFDKDREEVIKRSKEKLEFAVNAGRCLESNKETLKLAEEHPEFIIPCMGIHPTYTDSFGQVEEVLDQLSEEDAAVGEIGLDYHHVDEEELREQQRQVFRSFIEAAGEMGRPVIVHSRDAEGEAVDILSEYDVDVFLHCFNSSVELAEEAADKGFLIGVTTQVLYSSKVQSIVEALGLENLLLETDSPFLYPDGRNEPVHVVESAEKIAELNDVAPEKVVEMTSENATNFFR